MDYRVLTMGKLNDKSHINVVDSGESFENDANSANEVSLSFEELTGVDPKINLKDSYVYMEAALDVHNQTT